MLEWGDENMCTRVRRGLLADWTERRSDDQEKRGIVGIFSLKLLIGWFFLANWLKAWRNASPSPSRMRLPPGALDWEPAQGRPIEFSPRKNVVRTLVGWMIVRKSDGIMKSTAILEQKR